MSETFLASPTLHNAEAIATWLNALVEGKQAGKIIDWHIIPIAGAYQVIAHVTQAK